MARRVREPLGGPLGLLHGVRPGAVEGHDLGAVDQALAPEGDQLRLGGAPAGQRRRPLLGPAQVVDLLAGFDHGAVDDPGHHRRHLVGLDGDHGLVQQGHARHRLPLQQPRPAQAEATQRHQVRVAEAAADPGHLVEVGPGGRGVALDQGLERPREQQVALLDAVELAVVEQPAGPGHPAPTPGMVAPVEVRVGQPERAPHGALHLAPAQERVMGARPELGAVVVPAHQVGGGGQPAPGPPGPAGPGGRRPTAGRRPPPMPAARRPVDPPREHQRLPFPAPYRSGRPADSRGRP